MDRTHILAAPIAHQTARQGSDVPPTPAEVDLFYEIHGHEVFRSLYRRRGTIRALAARVVRGAERKCDFAAAPSSR